MNSQRAMRGNVHTAARHSGHADMVYVARRGCLRQSGERRQAGNEAGAKIADCADRAADGAVQQASLPRSFEWEWEWLRLYFSAELDGVCIWQSTDEYMCRLVITKLTQMPTFSLGGADPHIAQNRTRTAPV